MRQGILQFVDEVGDSNVLLYVLNMFNGCCPKIGYQEIHKVDFVFLCLVVCHGSKFTPNVGPMFRARPNPMVPSGNDPKAGTTSPGYGYRLWIYGSKTMQLVDFCRIMNTHHSFFVVCWSCELWKIPWKIPWKSLTPQELQAGGPMCT